jgi:two-component system, LytTR family, sensor histidine kinase AlgZ
VRNSGPDPQSPFDLLPTGVLRPALVAQTLLFNELIALPVALAMAAVDGAFLRYLAIASLYSQTIGLLCLLASVVTFRRLDRLAPARRLAAVCALYFVMGILGAEIARRISSVVFPWTAGGSVVASTAVGATVAVIVGISLISVRRLRARVVATEFEALQARINPHFLFNTLNSIAALIREDPARAETVTLQLSALFRYTLEAPRQGLVSLEDEITIVEGYLGIEQARLADRLAFEIDVDRSLLGVRVPALILQPLVENAIKHGIASSVTGGTLRVRGWRDRDRVHLAVTNTGDVGHAAQGTGEGLVSVRTRLRATFGQDATLTLTPSPGLTEARISFRADIATAPALCDAGSRRPTAIS